MELTAVKNQLVTYSTVHTCINDAECIFQFLSHVVRTYNCCCCRFAQALFSHHTDIAVGDECHVRIAIERARYAIILSLRHSTNQVRSAAYSTYTGSATAVRTGKGLV